MEWLLRGAMGLYFGEGAALSAANELAEYSDAHADPHDVSHRMAHA